ncbi:MAG: S24 family peptidase [Alphaproteobacteria bacterium]
MKRQTKAARAANATALPAAARSIGATALSPIAVGTSTEPAARAFPLVSDVPASCRLILADDHHAEPDVRLGEYAVVDTSDRTIQWGEPYAVQYSNSTAMWRVREVPATWKLGTDKPCAMLDPLERHTKEELDAMRGGGAMPRGGLRMSDGPIYMDHLREILIGRIVGVYEAAAAPSPSLAPHMGYLRVTGDDDPRIREPGVYAMTVEGTCFAPQINHGDMVVLTPNHQAEPGDYVVLYPVGGGKPVLKRLVSAPPPALKKVKRGDAVPLVMVEMFNPCRRLGTRVDKIAAMHPALKIVPAPDALKMRSRGRAAL